MKDYLTPGQIRKIVKKMEAHKAAIAKHRDGIRDLISELEAVGDTASDAVDHIEYAVESLSQYV